MATNWRTVPYTKSGVTGLNGRCVAQLNALQNLPDETPMLSQAQWVAKRARSYAAVDTGYMRDHTVAKATGANTAQVNSTAPYAEFQEFGTYKMSAQPFLRPALADAAIELPSMTAKEVNTDIRRRVSRA